MGKQNRYKDLEKSMTMLLLASVAAFILYLFFAGAGVIWSKVIMAIFAIIMPLLCLTSLYLSKEILRQRSLWLTAGFTGVFLCTVVSLIANYPSPV